MQGAEHDALETLAPGAHSVGELHNAADAGFPARKEGNSSTWLKTDGFFFFFFLDFGSEIYRTLSHLSWVMTL